MNRYVETAPGCDLDLSDNTNLWGPPPSVASGLGRPPVISRYPSAYSPQLKDSLARYLGVDPETIVTGCGSDDVLDSTIRAFGKRGGTVAINDPTFSMIPLFAEASGLDVIRVDACRGGLREAMTRANADVTYLCSPNNPTGGVIKRDVIEAIAKSLAGVVIVDEAYAEFTGDSCIDLLQAFPNLIVTRTMSKAFGLAGLRVGYGITSPTMVERVERARGPYKLSSIAEAIAIDVLADDQAWMRERVSDAVAARQMFASALSDIGLTSLESQANFVLIPLVESGRVAGGLRARGIAVREFTGLSGIGDAIRITIGPWPMMERCIAALRETMS